MFTALQFRAEIEAFLDRNSALTPTNFGRLVARDGNLVGDIAAGRMPSLRTVERVAAWMERHDGRLSPAQIKRLVRTQQLGAVRGKPIRTTRSSARPSQ